MSRILNELSLEELRTKLAAIFERRSSDEERCRIRMRQLPDGKRSVWIPPPMRTNLTRQSHGEGPSSEDSGSREASSSTSTIGGQQKRSGKEKEDRSLVLGATAGKTDCSRGQSSITRWRDSIDGELRSSEGARFTQIGSGPLDDEHRPYQGPGS